VTLDPPKFRNIRLYEHIAHSIRSRIVSGELREGERLPTEQQLADRYGVSRNVVRESIRVLATDGLVRVRQGSGTYITNTTSQALGDSLELALAVGARADDLRHLIEIREIIEPAVAALAAQRATPADLESLAKEVAAMDKGLPDIRLFIESDHRFHLAIAKATQNHMVCLLLYPIVDLLNEQRKKVSKVPGSAQIAQQFHHRILNAIKSKNPTEAADAMRAHLQHVSGVLMNFPTSGPEATSQKTR